MKIRSKQPGIFVKSVRPHIDIFFRDEKDVKEMTEEQAEKILRNANFEAVKEKKGGGD